MAVKHFGYWLLGGLAAFFVSHSLRNYLVLGGYVALTAALYVVDLLRDPMRPCWRCSGEGEHRSGIFRYATGDCRACGRVGRQRRLGAVILGIRAR